MLHVPVAHSQSSPGSLKFEGRLNKTFPSGGEGEGGEAGGGGDVLTMSQ